MGVVHFLNVKDGDCSIIQHTSGRVSMIDICNGNVENQYVTDSRDPMRTILESLQGDMHQKNYPVNPINYLNSFDIKYIFRFILTHPDMDHMDGIKRLFSEFTVNCFWDTANNKKMSDGSFGGFSKEDWLFYQKIRKGALNYYAGSVNCYYNADNANRTGDGDFLQILCPTEALIKDVNEHGDYNNGSYVILYNEDGRKILFCGDAGEKEWNVLLRYYPNRLRNIDVLIAPHHGRKSGGNDDFLDILKPKLTLFGNAKSDFLNYSDWNSRKLLHFTNNQGGTFVLVHLNRKIEVYCTNQSFAEKVVNFFGWFTYYVKAYNAWYLITI